MQEQVALAGAEVQDVGLEEVENRENIELFANKIGVL